MVDRDADATAVGPASPLRRSGRNAMPTAKAWSVQNTVDNLLASRAKNNGRVTRNASATTELDLSPQPAVRGRKAEVAKSGVQRMLELMEKSYAEMTEMKEKVNELHQSMEEIQLELSETKNELKQAREELGHTMDEMQLELSETKHELKQVREELGQTRATLDALTNSTTWSSAQPSFADVARTPPESQPSNVRTLSTTRTSSTSASSAIYCTIEVPEADDAAIDKVTAKAVRTLLEREFRAGRSQDGWRCRAVTEDRTNSQRMRIVCRDENEQDIVKKTIAEKLPLARILEDGGHRIRVDGVPRAVALDEQGNDLPGVADIFSAANDTEVLRASWLSDRRSKQYGSLVVELTQASEARRFLEEGFFYVGDISATTAEFKRRPRPKQCYNCQELTPHKAAECKKPQVCAKCAEKGHRHSECTATTVKCVPCGGPHESYSKTCRLLYPARNE